MESGGTAAAGRGGGDGQQRRSGGGWGWRTVEQVQAWSGLGFGVFLGLHLTNAWLAPLGQVAYDELLAVLRRVYQGGPGAAPHRAFHAAHHEGGGGGGAGVSPFRGVPTALETVVVLLPLALHAFSSMALVYRRLRQQQRQASGSSAQQQQVYGTIGVPWHLALHRYTGYVAAAFIGGHVLATRGPSWWLGHAPADFSSIAFTMAGPLATFYYLYYIVFPSAAAYHSFYGISRALRALLPAEWTYKNRLGWVRDLFRVEKGYLFNGLVLASTALSVLAASAFAGYLFPILDKGRYLGIFRSALLSSILVVCTPYLMWYPHAEHWQVHSLFIPSFLLQSPIEFDS